MSQMVTTAGSGSLVSRFASSLAQATPQGAPNPHGPNNRQSPPQTLPVVAPRGEMGSSDPQAPAKIRSPYLAHFTWRSAFLAFFPIRNSPHPSDLRRGANAEKRGKLFDIQRQHAY